MLNRVAHFVLQIVVVLIIGERISHAATITGTDFASRGLGTTGSGYLYVIIEPGPSENWALTTFDLSSVSAGDIAGNATLTLYVESTWTGIPLNATIEIDALASAYDPSNLGSVSIPVSGTELDSESFTGFVPGDALTFTIPEATLIGWANSPSTNYGIAIGETAWSSSSTHSDFSLATGQDHPAPEIAFAEVPEPSMWLPVPAGFTILWLAATKRRSPAVR
jgi:hypothetical protein